VFWRKRTDEQEMESLDAEILEVTRSMPQEEARRELDRRGLTERSRRMVERQYRRKRLRSSWFMLLGWVWLGIWIYALVRAWHAGIGWFLFWLILGPVIIATAMGLLGLRERRSN
jgi:Flp pilus assembly protein TadB